MQAGIEISLAPGKEAALIISMRSATLQGICFERRQNDQLNICKYWCYTIVSAPKLDKIAECLKE